MTEVKDHPVLFSGPMVNAILAGRKTQTRRIIKFAEQPKGHPYIPACIYPDGRGNWVGWDADEPGLAEFTKTAYRSGEGFKCPYGAPGDRLWVRETWQYYDWTEDGQPFIRYAADNAERLCRDLPEEGTVDVWEKLSRPENFSIDGRARDRRWRPSIFMPRWASRITLEICSVRVERLNNISEEDAIAEGIKRWLPKMDTQKEYDDKGFLRALFGFGDFPEGRNRATARTARDAYQHLWETIHGPGSWDLDPWIWVIEFRRIDQP